MMNFEKKIIIIIIIIFIDVVIIIIIIAVVIIILSLLLLSLFWPLGFLLRSASSLPIQHNVITLLSLNFFIMSN